MNKVLQEGVKKMTIINLIFGTLLSAFLFVVYSMISLDYTNNQLEKEIRMNIYDKKESFEIEINKNNLEIAKKIAYEMNYTTEEYRLNDDEMILKFKKSIEEDKK